jgi:hypothetical protein
MLMSGPTNILSHFHDFHGGVPIGRTNRELVTLHRREHQSRRGWGVWAKPHAHPDVISWDEAHTTSDADLARLTHKGK